MKMKITEEQTKEINSLLRDSNKSLAEMDSIEFTGNIFFIEFKPMHDLPYEEPIGIQKVNKRFLTIPNTQYFSPEFTALRRWIKPYLIDKNIKNIIE